MNVASRCTFVVEPEIEEACNTLGSWLVYYREGTGRVLVNKPLVRCSAHVADTVKRLAAAVYPYYLDRVERVQA